MVSGKRAKELRRLQPKEEKVEQPEVEPVVALDAGTSLFESEFRQLCLRTGRRAAFLIVAAERPDGSVQLGTGGDGTLVAVLDDAMGIIQVRYRAPGGK